MGFEFKPSIWFVCRFCRQAFRYLFKLKEHRVECHLGECLNTKCLIFEERCLNYEWVPSTDKDDPEGNQCSNIQHTQSDSSRPRSIDDAFISRLNISNRQNTYKNPFVSIQRLTPQELNNLLNHNASFSHINSRTDTQSPGCRGIKRAADHTIMPHSAPDNEGDEPWTEKKCKSEVDVEILTQTVTQETVFESEVKKVELNLEDVTHLPENQNYSLTASDFISMPNDKDSQEIELEDREFIVASIVQSSDGTENIQFVSTNTQFPLLEHATTTTLDTVLTSASDFGYDLDSDLESQTNINSNFNIRTLEENASGNGDISLPYLTYINTESTTDVLETEEHIESEANNVIYMGDEEDVFQMDTLTVIPEEIVQPNIPLVSRMELITSIIKNCLNSSSAETPVLLKRVPDVQVIGSPEKETSPNEVASEQENYYYTDSDNGNCATGSQPASHGRSKFGQDELQVIMSTTKGGSATEIPSDNDNSVSPSDSDSESESDSNTEPRPWSQGQSKGTLPAEKCKLPLKEWLLLQKEAKHSDGSSNVVLIDPDPTISDQELPTIDENHPVTCLLCARLLVSEIDVRIHVENCWWHNKKKHRCCVPCEFTFESSSQLRRHQKYDHLREDEKPSGEGLRLTLGDDQLDYSDVEDIILSDQDITLGDWVKKQQAKSWNVVLLDPDPTTATTPLTISKASPIRCQLCSTELHSEHGVKLHVKACWRYNQKRHTYCVPCKRIFSGRGILSMHNLHVHSKRPKFRFYCTSCKSVFNDGLAYQHSLSLREFLNRRANAKYTKNPSAATNTSSKPQEISFIEWLNHQKETNPFHRIVLEPDPLSVGPNFEGVSDTNPVTCKLCSRKFTGEFVLKSHAEICWFHNKQIHRYCFRCEKTYPNAACFREHYARKHSNLPKPTCVCKVCPKPKTFMGLDSLKIHEDTREDPESGKQFKCNLCNKPFELKDERTHHRLAHCSEKQFECPQRPAASKRKQTLTCRLGTHNQDCL